MNKVLKCMVLGLALAPLLAVARQSEPPEVLPGRYIVEFVDPPVAAFEGRRGPDGGWQMAPTRTKQGTVNFSDPAVKVYQEFLADRSKAMIGAMEALLGGPVKPRHRYQYLTHGVSLSLTAEQAAALSTLDGVKAVYPVTVHRPHTDAGPQWIGAPAAWATSGSMGEGVVVGVLDSGVNWDHRAFAEVGGDGFEHSNPRGRQYGLCSRAQVRCNNKLIGVYDFTEEGDRLGRDVDGHGTHVASTAVGNIRQSNVVGNTASVVREVSGVAPHANLISYKVCLADNPDTPEDENVCILDAILNALDQLVVDRVTLVNYSIGGASSDPWTDRDGAAMLNARAAGTLIVTSAGNDGSAPDTISSPANAPWLLTVANITHNRRFQNTLDSLLGGSSGAPPDLNGVGFSGAFGPAKIVHGADFGSPLCGAGEAELESSCEAHTGSTNPFPPGTFNGEIVVCDRGIYGRIEKGFNLRAAGAGGYVLANTQEQGESIVSDDHCLPGTHLGSSDGDQLRAWLAAGGDDHSGRIAGQTVVVDDLLGDQVAASSSRGPDGFVPNVIKPDLAAPGSNILAAGVEGNTSSFKSGTSMASPHVAGSAALVLSVRPELTPGELYSMLVTTAFNDNMIDSDGRSLADAFDVGAGRVNPEAALRAGLVMDISPSAFINADPARGGEPGLLNLPTIASSRCIESCSFQRQVSALDGGQWTATVVSRNGVSGVVSPATLVLAAGESAQLNITLDVSEPSLIGQSVTGYVVLTPADSSVATQRLVFQVTADAGDLPTVLNIETAANRGSQFFDLAGLAALPQANFRTRGLSRARAINRSLAEDTTNADPYNNLTAGVYAITARVQNPGAVLYAQVDADLATTDLDLFVGLDLDGDFQPDANEELCRSTSPGPSEICVLPAAQEGQHWIMVQNWRASTPGAVDASSLTLAVVDAENDNTLVATGPGSTSALAPFDLRLSWDNPPMIAGERWVGVLEPSAGDQLPAVGAIPVVLSRLGGSVTGTAANPDLDSLPARLLLDGVSQSLTLAAHQGHSRLFMDLPASASSMTLQITAPPQVQWQLVAQPAQFSAPAVAPASSQARVLATGSGNASVQRPVSAERYYLVPLNTDASPQSLSFTLGLERGGALRLQGEGSNTVDGPTPGLWFNPARNGAGFNLNQVDGQLIVEWYTYLEDGTPIWYLAQAPYSDGDDWWQATVNQFRWDGARAAATAVGEMNLVFSNPSNATLNFSLHGVTGSEPVQVIISDLSCATNGVEVERTGLWFMPALPGFGYSILHTGTDQVQINYLYGPDGSPRWVLGQGSAQEQQISLAQFSGFCPTCDALATPSMAVGSNQLSYTSGQAAQVITELQFAPPLAGQWLQSGPLNNLTPTLKCN